MMTYNLFWKLGKKSTKGIEFFTAIGNNTNTINLQLTFIKLYNSISIIKLRMIESFTTYVFKDSIEIDTDNYPELRGKSNEEILAYIEEKGWKMNATDDVYNNLYEQLEGQDTLRDDVKEGDCSIEIE